LTVRRERFLATSCKDYISTDLISKTTRTNPQIPYLRDTLLVLSSEKNSPCDAAGVLALKEKRLCLTVLETEDLAVTTDVKLALFSNRQRSFYTSRVC